MVKSGSKLLCSSVWRKKKIVAKNRINNFFFSFFIPSSLLQTSKRHPKGNIKHRRKNACSMFMVRMTAVHSSTDRFVQQIHPIFFLSLILRQLLSSLVVGSGHVDAVDAIVYECIQGGRRNAIKIFFAFPKNWSSWLSLHVVTFYFCFTLRKGWLSWVTFMVDNEQMRKKATKKNWNKKLCVVLVLRLLWTHKCLRALLTSILGRCIWCTSLMSFGRLVIFWGNGIQLKNIYFLESCATRRADMVLEARVYSVIAHVVLSTQMKVLQIWTWIDRQHVPSCIQLRYAYARIIIAVDRSTHVFAAPETSFCNSFHSISYAINLFRFHFSNGTSFTGCSERKERSIFYIRI